MQAPFLSKVGWWDRASCEARNVTKLSPTTAYFLIVKVAKWASTSGLPLVARGGRRCLAASYVERSLIRWVSWVDTRPTLGLTGHWKWKRCEQAKLSLELHFLLSCSAVSPGQNEPGSVKIARPVFPNIAINSILSILSMSLSILLLQTMLYVPVLLSRHLRYPQGSPHPWLQRWRLCPYLLSCFMNKS